MGKHGKLKRQNCHIPENATRREIKMSAKITGPFVATEYIDKRDGPRPPYGGQTGICSLTFIAIWTRLGSNRRCSIFAGAPTGMRSLREQ